MGAGPINQRVWARRPSEEERGRARRKASGAAGPARCAGWLLGRRPWAGWRERVRFCVYRKHCEVKNNSNEFIKNIVIPNITIDNI